LTPEQVADLLITPLVANAVATQVATVVSTGSPTYRVPLVVEDPTTAWVAEGDEIIPTDPEFAEVLVSPFKLAGLTIISSELANDSDPSAAEQVGAGLARDLARKVDAAFFGSLTAPAPTGLGGLQGVSEVDGGAAFTDLDVFAEAASVAESVGANLTSWVLNPGDLLTLARLKAASGSNVPLLAAQPGQAARRVVEGLPIYSSPNVPQGTAWGIPADRAVVVVRQDASVDTDASVFFTSDRVAVRAITRIGFAFPQPAAVVRIVLKRTAPTP